MKLCPQCDSLKPYDPSAKAKSKASGFHQAVCWDCYLVNQKKKVNDYYYREKRRSATCQACGTTVPRCYFYKGAQVCMRCYKRSQKSSLHGTHQSSII